MSRVGKLPITIPDKVKVTFKEGVVFVEGPLGKLDFALPTGVQLKIEGNTLQILRETEAQEVRAKHGLVRALVMNMINGVSKGFSRELDINGVGYRAELKGKSLLFSLGFSHPVDVAVPEGVKVTVEKQTHLVIQGFDKQKVGQFAADIRSLKKPEPFKGKGIKYVEEVIRRKAGKAAATGAK